MYVIEYETGDRADFNGSRRHLVEYLTHAEHPIKAIYEQVTVVTKAVRMELSRLPLNTLSSAARGFVSSLR